jgi:hypothetical protein
MASILIECAANHLGRNRWSAGGHADHRQIAISIDSGGHQPASSQFRDHRAKRASFARRKFARRSDHVIIEIERRTHLE